MYKVISIIIALFVMSFSVIPFFYSYNAFAAAPSIETRLPEPTPEDGNQFWFVVSDGKEINTRLYGLYLTSNSQNIISNSCFINIYTDGSWHFIAYNDDTQMAIGYIWMIFDLYGTLLSKSSGTINANSSHNFNIGRNYTNGYIYYWGTSNIGRQGTTQPDQLQILWNQNITYHNLITNDLASLGIFLSDIENGIDLLHSDFVSITTIVNNILTKDTQLVSNTNSLISKVDTILSNWDWFKQTFYSQMFNTWNITNSKLDEIISLLEGESTTYFEDDTELASDVDEYISQEHYYVDQLDDIASDLDSNFGLASGLMQNNSSTLGFISEIFNTFMGPGSLPYYILSFSMILGLVLLILGRSKIT